MMLYLIEFWGLIEFRGPLALRDSIVVIGGSVG
jgi:hypothetical protein